MSNTSASSSWSSSAVRQLPPELSRRSTRRFESSWAQTRAPSRLRPASARSSRAVATAFSVPVKRPVSTPPLLAGAQPATASNGRSRAIRRFMRWRIIDSEGMAERVTVPRGRHAPPLEVRLTVQRQRLLEAAAEVFAQRGYADASAEAISRAAGMSKATFYEHFGNKEEAILALFDEAARVTMGRLGDATAAAPEDPEARVRAGLKAFVDALADFPAASQTLLVEIIGAGPQAMERRDAIL